MVEWSKTWKYHICDIIYNINKDNVFNNKKWIKFISITDPYLIKYTENFGDCTELIDTAVNTYQIASLKKQLDKEKIIFSHVINEKWLITLFEYQNIKGETNTRHKINYMGLGSRV